jgi:hypothetical protein
MRRNAQRVSELRADIINEIKDLMKSKQLEQIEFKNLFTVQVDVTNYETDYDLGVELIAVQFLTNDGFVIAKEQMEINLDELNPYELAWILDELEEGNVIPVMTLEEAVKDIDIEKSQNDLDKKLN